MSILGLDIGGANIKAADEAGRTLSRPFAMWKHPERLVGELISILSEFPQTERVAVTMTAELADCFATKSEGVRFILDAVETGVARTLSRHRACPGGSAASALLDESQSNSSSAEAGEPLGQARWRGDVTKSPVFVWTTGGRFVSANESHEQPMQVAAANWHALATWCGRTLLDGYPRGQRKAPLTLTLSPEDGGEGTRKTTQEQNAGLANAGLALDSRLSALGSALLIDIGTTTTDIIPLVDGRPNARGLTDVERLQTGELSYSGVKRTPLCAIAHAVPFRDGYCPLAAELFATTLDVYLLLGDIAEDAEDLETANGKPATKTAAHDRLARMLCGDREEVSFDEAVEIARFLADVQRQRLAGSLERVASRFETPVETVIVSGFGSFLARRLIAENHRTATANILSLDDQLSPGIAESACAHAVARLLASESQMKANT